MDVPESSRKRLASGEQQRALFDDAGGEGESVQRSIHGAKGTPLEDDQRPWESMGISRPTWYRDRARCVPKGPHGGARNFK